METTINYQEVENIIAEKLTHNATEIAKIYIEKHPEVLGNYDADTVRRKIAWYLEYRKSPSSMTKTRPESMVLLISDVHYGRRTVYYHNPELVDYNEEKAQVRLQNITKSVQKIYDIIFKSYQINDLHILFLGDIIDGELTFPAQQINIEIPEFKQITNCADTLGNMIDGFTNIFNKVYIRAVAGNHSHNPKMHNVNRGDNILYEILKREYKRINKVDMFYSPNFYDIHKVQNTSFLLYHGYAIRNYFNIPYYGIYNWGVRRIKSFSEGWDVLVMGHFHTYSILSFPSFNCFLNGTMVSSDEYSLHYFGKDGDLMFHLLGVHPERGITFRYALSGE